MLGLKIIKADRDLYGELKDRIPAFSPMDYLSLEVEWNNSRAKVDLK
jgi:hypothetical protein